MQKRYKTSQVTQERDSQADVQGQRQAEEPITQTQESHPLERTTSGIGDAACVAKHVSTIQRTGLFHPMNGLQKAQQLLRLQKLYGNRFVQRVIAQYIIQTKLQVSQLPRVLQAKQVAYVTPRNRIENMVFRTPSVHSWSFRNSEKTSSDNCCQVCPGARLGVDTKFYNKHGLNSFTNAMELQAFIANHEPGAKYDIKRTVESTSWEKKGNVWLVEGKPKPPGTDDDPNDIDECLTPTLGPPPRILPYIFSFDAPGYLGISNPNPQVTDMVHKASYEEFVEIDSPSGKLTDANVFYWHSIMWVKRKDGTWTVDTSKSEIEPGAVTVGTSGP